MNENNYNKELDELIEEFHLDNENGYGLCDFGRLTEIAEDYPEIIPDWFDETDFPEYIVGSDICTKLGKNYTCLYSEDTMTFWDKTRWDMNSYGELKEV